MGTQMLVVTDDDAERGRALARTLGMEVFDMRGRTAMPMLSVDAGLDRAEAMAAQGPGKPVVVAEVWDNPGGGVAGDGTLILHRIIERGLPNVAVATIWDPIAVSFCRAAGAGARIPLRFGGKAGPDGGAPIDATVEVLRAVAEGWQSFGASRVTLGPAALVRLEGTTIHVILNTNRTQAFEPAQPGARSTRAGDPAHRVDQPFLRGLRADRRRGRLHRRRGGPTHRPEGDGLPQDDPSDMAAGRQPARLMRDGRSLPYGKTHRRRRSMPLLPGASGLTQTDGSWPVWS